jgi:antitoxin (DNA-binding transcriptional repressor) of toxin-antitoxin stability system
MREIQASEAKTHLPQLLDEIERGKASLSPGMAGRLPG